ncbi:MAG TPA: hypothetical protein VF433_02960 [Cellvibrio sp.]
MKSVHTLCLAILAVAASQASAQSQNLQQAIEQCRLEQNALKRLVCYDEIGTAGQSAITEKAVPAATIAPAATATTAPATTTAAPAAGAEFGLEHRKKIDESTADQIYATVKTVSYSPRKELIVEFDNGQRWRQNGTEYYKIAVGESHYLKRGALNSFFLGNDNNNRTIRVRREQ